MGPTPIQEGKEKQHYQSIELLSLSISPLFNDSEESEALSKQILFPETKEFELKNKNKNKKISEKTQDIDVAAGSHSTDDLERAANNPFFQSEEVTLHPPDITAYNRDIPLIPNLEREKTQRLQPKSTPWLSHFPNSEESPVPPKEVDLGSIIFPGTDPIDLVKPKKSAEKLHF